MTKTECLHCRKYIVEDSGYCCPEHESDHKQSIVNRELALVAGIPEERICMVCGNPLTRKTNAKYHKGECRRIGKAKHNKIKEHANDKKTCCPECGVEVITGKFCCTEHRVKWWRRNKAAVYADPNRKVGERIKKNHLQCAHCKEWFYSHKASSTHCPKPECQKDRRNRYFKAYFKNIDEGDKKFFTDRKNKVHRTVMKEAKKQRSKIQAKCPLCEKIYLAKITGKIEDKIMPRIYCDNCRAVVARIERGDYGKLGFSQMQEYHVI